MKVGGGGRTGPSRLQRSIRTREQLNRGQPMFEANDIREWRSCNVVDIDGNKIGTLESVYVDTTSDLAAFATVTVGMPSRRRLAFVPLAGASVGPGYLKVRHTKSQIKKAPSIDTDGELPVDDEAAIFAHYELAYVPGTSGERRLARR